MNEKQSGGPNDGDVNISFDDCARHAFRLFVVCAVGVAGLYFKTLVTEIEKSTERNSVAKQERQSLTYGIQSITASLENQAQLEQSRSNNLSRELLEFRELIKKREHNEFGIDKRVSRLEEIIDKDSVLIKGRSKR